MTVPQNAQSAGLQTAQPLKSGSTGGLTWPGPRARLLARLRAGSLDRELLAGADPAGSPQLAARALALTSPRSRATLVAGLERWLSPARGATSRLRVLPRRDLAVAGEAEVRAIVTELRGSTRLYAQGLAQLRALITDGTGPAYVGERDVLAGLLAEARAAIAGHAPPAPVGHPGRERRPSEVWR